MVHYVPQQAHILQPALAQDDALTTRIVLVIRMSGGDERAC
jgi:hypothetical protein